MTAIYPVTQFSIPLRALASVVGAISKDDTRVYLCHPVISHREGEKYPFCVATDGHRAYRAEMIAPDVPVLEKDLVVPMRLVNYILTAPGGWDREVELSYRGEPGKGNITAVVDDMTFTLADWPNWTYPDWRRVMPDPSKFKPVQKIGLDSTYFADLDKSARAFTGRNKGTCLAFEFTADNAPVSITATTPDGPTWLGTLMPMRM